MCSYLYSIDSNTAIYTEPVCFWGAFRGGHCMHVRTVFDDFLVSGMHSFLSEKNSFSFPKNAIRATIRFAKSSSQPFVPWLGLCQKVTVEKGFAKSILSTSMFFWVRFPPVCAKVFAVCMNEALQARRAHRRLCI
jgi:hypothetical protein